MIQFFCTETPGVASLKLSKGRMLDRHKGSSSETGTNPLEF